MGTISGHLVNEDTPHEVEGWKKSTNGFPMISVSDNIKSLAGSEGVRVCWSRDPR